ncbi:hypothetical protein EVAR_40255_1 [Eumeta japonica]|uniref:Uncharacterized protein n=1 Tax=Eumeta variegata TaxID=151549 RepID=A0A4C1Y5T9_EUMVA|nr:hypothetical protein EVAR_40255_1 [Eumeta japonica]
MNEATGATDTKCSIRTKIKILYKTPIRIRDEPAHECAPIVLEIVTAACRELNDARAPPVFHNFDIRSLQRDGPVMGVMFRNAEEHRLEDAEKQSSSTLIKVRDGAGRTALNPSFSKEYYAPTPFSVYLKCYFVIEACTRDV